MLINAKKVIFFTFIKKKKNINPFLKECSPKKKQFTFFYNLIKSSGFSLKC